MVTRRGKHCFLDMNIQITPNKKIVKDMKEKLEDVIYKFGEKRERGILSST